jgi:hypothetical protein
MTFLDIHGSDPTDIRSVSLQMKSNLKHTKPGMGHHPIYQYLHISTNLHRHLVTLVMESDRENPLFMSPIGQDAKHILDLGTGQGNWAMYVP